MQCFCSILALRTELWRILVPPPSVAHGPAVRCPPRALRWLIIDSEATDEGFVTSFSVEGDALSKYHQEKVRFRLRQSHIQCVRP